MKATYTFNLPEEREEHEHFLKGVEYDSRLLEIYNLARSYRKQEQDERVIDILTEIMVLAED